MPPLPVSAEARLGVLRREGSRLVRLRSAFFFLGGGGGGASTTPAAPRLQGQSAAVRETGKIDIVLSPMPLSSEAEGRELAIPWMPTHIFPHRVRKTHAATVASRDEEERQPRTKGPSYGLPMAEGTDWTAWPVEPALPRSDQYRSAGNVVPKTRRSSMRPFLTVCRTSGATGECPSRLVPWTAWRSAAHPMVPALAGSASCLPSGSSATL